MEDIIHPHCKSIRCCCFIKSTDFRFARYPLMFSFVAIWLDILVTTWFHFITETNRLGLGKQVADVLFFYRAH